MNPSSSKGPLGFNGPQRATGSNSVPNQRVLDGPRAEMWMLEEIQNLIDFRTEVESKFNTAKSNNHLWEYISAKVRENGFEYSPSMCADNWASLLIEFYSFKKQSGRDLLANLSPDEIVEYLTGKKKIVAPQKGPLIPEAANPTNIDKGKERPNDNLERSMDNEECRAPIKRTARNVANRAHASNCRGNEHPSGINETGVLASNGACACHCRGSADARRVITVSCGDQVKRIGIDGSPDRIKEVISSAFDLRSRRPFWLEDEDGVVRSIDRDMPIKKYTLHLGQGLTIKMVLYDAAGESPVYITFYGEEDFHYFLQRFGYIGLTDFSCGKYVHSFHDLHPGEIYQGYRDRGN